MRKSVLLGALGGMLALTGLLVFLSGCGGAGGPINVPPTPGGPSTSAEFLALLPAAQKGAAYIGTADCVVCHTDPASKAPQIDLAAFHATKHSGVSVGCEQCHGPGAAHKASPSKDTILTFPLITKSVVCAQCHGPMANQVAESAHGERVEDVFLSTPSNTCIRCHSAPANTQLIGHELAKGTSAADIDKAILALTVDQLNALKAATSESASCATCHDAHKTTTNLTWKDGKQAQLRFPESNSNTAALPAAGLPGVYTTFNQVCGRCHNGRSVDGSDLGMASTARPNMHDSPQYQMLMGFGAVEIGGGPPVRNTAHASAPGQCTHCHMPNANHSMVVNFETSCAPCHTAGDAAARYALRGAIEAQLVTLRTRMQNWALSNLGDLDFWDYTSLIPAPKVAPSQTKVPMAVRRARHNYYFIVRDLSNGIHNSTYTRYALQVANTNLDSIGAKSVKINLTPDQIKAVLKSDRMKMHQIGSAAE